MILQDWETEGEGFIHYCSNSDTRATHGQSPFFNFIFLLGYNCFTVLLVSVVQHRELAICIHISLPSWTSLPPPPHSTPRPSQSTELSSPFCASRQLSISHMVVDLCLCYSVNSFPLSPSLPVSTSAFSTSAPLFLACKCVHLSHFSRFHGCVSSCSVTEALQPHGLYSPPVSSVHGDSSGKNTEVGCHSLLQGIFPTRGLNPALLHCRQILFHLKRQGSPLDSIYMCVNLQ